MMAHAAVAVSENEYWRTEKKCAISSAYDLTYREEYK
jgi:hypothetical protein